MHDLHSTVIVTGSTKGIGLGIAEAFLASDYLVGFNGRDQQRLNFALAGKPKDRILGLQGDVTSPADAQRIVSSAVTTFGSLNALVCNVGSGRSAAPGDETYDEWMRILALNLLSATNMVEAAKEALVASRGSIVCISSICGSEVVEGAPVTYSAAKAALNAFIRGVARPLGKRGVRINGVAAGNILFPGSVWENKLSDHSEEVAQMLRREVALGRLGEINDISRLVLWLTSPSASFVTGSIFTVDGGQSRS